MLRALLEAADGPAAVHELFLGPFSAVVVVAEGQVLSARAGPFVDEDALFRLLLLPRRPVRSQIDPPRPSSSSLGAASELLDRFDAFARDLSRQSARAGGLTRVWAVRFVALKAVLQGLPDDVKRVVRLLDGTRDLQTLIAESPLPPPLTLRVVERLLQRGALERADLAADHDDDAVSSAPQVVDDATTAPPRAAGADRSWLQERESLPPAPAPPEPTTETPTTTTTTTEPTSPTTTSPEPAEPLLLHRRGHALSAASLPGAIPAPRGARGAELSAWLGPEDAFFEREVPATVEPPPETWAPWTLVVIVVAGACIGAVLALAFAG